MNKNIFIVIFLSLISSSLFAKSRLTDADRLAVITPESAFSLIKIEDDDLDTIATISSEEVFITGSDLSIPSGDAFLRAAIQKKSGKLLIQLFQSMRYGGNWRFYNGATYESMDGPVQAKFNSISRDVISCRGGCLYVEYVYFLVDEKVLRDFASKYQPGNLTGWQYKFNSRSGDSWKGSVSAAEISGFLRALDEYRMKKGI
jgi:hypothetical protein